VRYKHIIVLTRTGFSYNKTNNSYSLSMILYTSYAVEIKVIIQSNVVNSNLKMPAIKFELFNNSSYPRIILQLDRTFSGPGKKFEVLTISSIKEVRVNHVRVLDCISLDFIMIKLHVFTIILC